MSTTPTEREYFLDSIRAWLMLLGIPFHISLIYSSHTWHVNSQMPSWWLTLFNDFIHAFRMQVFFVISGYFSYMLFSAISAQALVESARGARGDTHADRHPAADAAAVHHAAVRQRQSERTGRICTLYEKYNTLVWELVSHLWFLLVLVVLTTVSLVIFQPPAPSFES